MALTKRYTAAALILAGAFVNLYEVEGFPFMRNADAELGYPADGFVGSDVASGARGNVYFPGSINRDLSGLTLNTTYYLTTDGEVADEVSAGEGDVRQKLGRAISSTQLIFAPADVPVDGGSGVVEVHAETIGDTSTTQFTITHNLNSEDVNVSVRYASGTKEMILTDWRTTGVNSVRVDFAVAPGTNEFRVVVIG